MIPGVDDGASSLAESIVALQTMAAQGVTHVITTPHFRASEINRSSSFVRRMEEIDRAWETLLELVKSNLPGFRIDRGLEIALDEPTVLTEDRRIRLAG